MNLIILFLIRFKSEYFFKIPVCLFQKDLNGIPVITANIHKYLVLLELNKVAWKIFIGLHDPAKTGDIPIDSPKDNFTKCFTGQAIR